MPKVIKINTTLPYLKQELFISSHFINFICPKIKQSGYDKLLLVADINAYNIQKSFSSKLTKGLNIKKIVFLKPTPNYKNYSACDQLFRELVKLGANRKSCIIAMGGGYVSDIAGYVASVYMRGIDFVQVSTTVMSMVDPIIGKVAINYGQIKNLLGAFYSPRYTFCDISFIESLSTKEKVYGLVEVWKHALLADNQKIVHEIECYLNAPNDAMLWDLIPFSIAVKKSFVETDSRDIFGRHKALSLGHTMANYFEKKPNVRHGVAVFYGIIFASVLAFTLGKLSSLKYSQILASAKLFEKRIGLISQYKKEMNFKKATKLLLLDKINHGQVYNFVLPTDNGFTISKNVPKEALKKAMNNFKKLDLT